MAESLGIAYMGLDQVDFYSQRFDPDTPAPVGRRADYPHDRRP
jgi:hypothetical protein